MGGKDEVTSSTTEITQSEEENSGMNDLIGCGLALIAALNAALAIIFVRKLADQVHCAITPMYYMMGMCIFCPIWLLVIPIQKATDLTLYGYELYLAIFGLALVYFVQQSTMAKSMEYNTVGIVQVILYLAIPFGCFLDWAVLNQPMSAMEMGGAAVICFLNISIATLRIKKIID